MKLEHFRRCAVVLGFTTVLVSSVPVASADPPDPHTPDITKSYCPGGQWGYGSLGVCDGEKYPDGSYWHQWLRTNIGGPRFHYDCVGGDEPLPGPPPPGGCDGAIPPAPPDPSAT
nr:hypothetical protein [Mycobacterium colombiense]